MRLLSGMGIAVTEAKQHLDFSGKAALSELVIVSSQTTYQILVIHLYQIK